MITFFIYFQLVCILIFILSYIIETEDLEDEDSYTLVDHFTATDDEDTLLYIVLKRTIYFLPFVVCQFIAFICKVIEWLWSMLFIKKEYR